MVAIPCKICCSRDVYVMFKSYSDFIFSKVSFITHMEILRTKKASEAAPEKEQFLTLDFTCCRDQNFYFTNTHTGLDNPS